MQKTVIQTKFTQNCSNILPQKVNFSKISCGGVTPRKHTFHMLSKLYILYKLYQPVLSPLTYIFIATPLYAQQVE